MHRNTGRRWSARVSLTVVLLVSAGLWALILTAPIFGVVLATAGLLALLPAQEPAQLTILRAIAFALAAAALSYGATELLPHLGADARVVAAMIGQLFA